MAPAVAASGLPVTAIQCEPCSGGFCVRWARAGAAMIRQSAILRNMPRILIPTLPPPLPRCFAAPSPRFAGRGISSESLLPAGGEKVAEGRMRGSARHGGLAVLQLVEVGLHGLHLLVHLLHRLLLLNELLVGLEEIVLQQLHAMGQVIDLCLQISITRSRATSGNQ